MTPGQGIPDVVKSIRRRWRIRLALEALALLSGVSLGLLLGWGLAWPLASAHPETISRGRLIVAAILGGSALLLFVRWYRRRPDDARVALYAEERLPGLSQTLTTSLTALGDSSADPSLVERVALAARRELAKQDDGRRLEARGIRRAGAWVGAMTVGSLAALVLGPPMFRDAAATLVNPSRRPPVAPAVTITVSPGNAEVPRGGAIEITARLAGVGTEGVELVVRADSAPEWTRIPMPPDSLGSRVGARLFDIVQPTEYFVEAGGIRSPSYRLTVVDLPAVRRITATIRFPAYTGLPAETIEEAGDLAVLRGSNLSFAVETTRPAKAATLVLESGQTIALEPLPNGRWKGAFRIVRDGFYRVDLETEDGRRVTGLQYLVDALEDRPPSVRFTAPGRDLKVSSIEEVDLQADAVDDFGVTGIVLEVAVNGGPGQRMVLSDTAVKALEELSAGTTLYLEDRKLVPGDLVSYFAEATDGAGQTAKSDMYFLQIRPFDLTYRQAEQAGGGGASGGGTGGGQSPEGLSERQRQIVVGTFNSIRDSAVGNAGWRENVATLTVAEGRLRTEVATLAQQLRLRRMESIDSTFTLIGAALDSAAVELASTEEQLGRQALREALAPGQRALQHLQRAEAAYREVQVQLSQQEAGGGGSQQQQTAEDLADLFELETDKLENQYESIQRESARQAEQQLDETAERLRRLANRQQLENDRAERMADALRNRTAGSASGGGASQRQLAQETEEAARQLERLARERNQPALAESARRLREAAEEMRRAAANPAGQGDRGEGALGRLRDATRNLERSRAAARREAVEELGRRAAEIKQQHAETAEEAASLPEDDASRAEKLEALDSRKDALADKVGELEKDAERIGRETAREQPEAARKLAEAVKTLRDGRVKDKIGYSKEVARVGSKEYRERFESGIAKSLDDVANRLSDAAGAVRESDGDRQARTLDRARDLVRGLESLKERARAAQREREARGQEEGQGGQSGRQGDGKGKARGGGEGQAGQAEGGGQGEGRGGRQSGKEGGAAGAGRPGEGPIDPSEGLPNGGSWGPNDNSGRFVRELRARRRSADSLRSELRGLGLETKDLDRVLQAWGRLDNRGPFRDPQGLETLESEVISGLKELEFALWRKFGEPSGQRPVAGATARIPPRYRDLVEEYFKSLSKDGKTEKEQR